MYLQPAIALDQFVTAGFGDRESRQARREARREARQKRKAARKDARQEKRQDKREDRKERRAERKVTRIHRKKARVKSKLARTPGASASASSATAEPTLQPAPMTYTPQPGATATAQPGQPGAPWSDDSNWDAMEQMIDEELDDSEEGDEPAEEEMEGIGAWQPFSRSRQAPTSQRNGAGMWGPSVRMGKTLRIQAAAGHRAAFIDLKPGLFLVAELPESVTKTEFGIAPLLAPLMITAAKRAMNEPPRQRQGPLSSLFRRRDEPVRYVEVQPMAQTAPLALPGPVADEPAPVVVPAPNVGWADDATVAAMYGCDECDRVKR